MAGMFSKLRDSSSGDQWDWKVLRVEEPFNGVAAEVYAVVGSEARADRLVSLLNADEA